MSYRIPIYEDDLTFEDREGWLWDDLERDMERRHRDWDDDLDFMRGDFFKRKSDFGTGKLRSMPDRLRYSKNLDDNKAIIEKDQNGCPIYRARFNVRDYKPNEVSVRMDKNKIMVSAKHEENDGRKSLSTEFNREVMLPQEVDPLSLQCTISHDGILTVDAPIPVPGYQAITTDPSTSGHSTFPRRTYSLESTDSSDHGKSIPPKRTFSLESSDVPASSTSVPPSSHTSTFATFISPKTSTSVSGNDVQTGNTGRAQPELTKQSSYSSQTSVSSSTSEKPISRGDAASVSNIDKQERYKVEVDIEDFKPEELTVKTVDKNLVVSARREERLGTRSSMKELNRQFSLPETVDPHTVKAFFSDSGKLFLEAPYL